MKQIDRFLRIIYKDFPLQRVFQLGMERHLYDKPYSKSWYSLFWLTPNQSGFEMDYLNEVKKIYREVYHDYNDDEVNYLLDKYTQLSKRVTPTGFKGNTINFFVYIADNLMFYQNGKVTIRFDNLLEWNGIINKIDANILFAMKAALEGHEILLDDPHKVDHDNNRLNTILSRGISDNHMHLKGSGYTSDMNWHDFSTEIHGDYLQAKSKNFIEILKTFDLDYEHEELAFLKIKVVKYYLFGKYLVHYSESEKYQEFKKNVSLLLHTVNKEELELIQSRIDDDLSILSSCWEEKYHFLFENPKYPFLVERVFLKELFSAYLSCKMSHFDLYLLNCYLLATNRFKKFFSQDNVGMGFEKFKRSENIKEDLLIRDDNSKIFDSVFDKYYSEKNVKKVEFRVAPKKNIKSYNSLISSLNKANMRAAKKVNRENDFLKYGIIVHFIKDKNDFNTECGVSRKENSYINLKNQVNPLLTYFESIQHADDIEKSQYDKIVGVDTANYELNVRPEVFGPSFRFLRKEIKESHNFGITYHAGEDFTTLANGLRAMDEVIEFLDYGSGDRFGHGLALGLNVDAYFKKKRYTIVSNVEEYFDDIVWMYHFIRAHIDRLEVKDFISNLSYTEYDILSMLEREFDRVKGYYNFDKLYTLYDFYEAYKLRGDDPEVYLEYNDGWNYDKVKFCCQTRINWHDPEHQSAANNPKARELYIKYHYCDKYKANHFKTFTGEASSIYIDAVKLVQFILRLKIYRMEIGIEGNPTSNRKISFINKYIDLPLLELNSSYIKPESKYNLSVSINTDDSAIFQTDLSQEYAYVVAALLREGHDIESVYKYIDYIRELSLMQSFVRDEDY